MLKNPSPSSGLTLLCDDLSVTGLHFQDGCLSTCCAKTNEASPHRTSEGAEPDPSSEIKEKNFNFSSEYCAIF